MTDDQTDVKEVAGEEASISEPSTEEPKATGEIPSSTEEATGQEEATTEEGGTETEEAPKKGAQARIKELNAKAKRAEEKARSLEDRLAVLTGSGEPIAPGAQYTPQIEPGQEYSPEQYKQDVLKTADALVTIKVKQSEAISRITTEANQVVRAYPQLDPASDSFDSELSDSITEATEAYVKASPYTASVKTFVDKLMKPYNRAVTKEVGKATENLAKQVSQAATRPTSVSTKGGKTDDEKSLAELEGELGFHY